MTDYVIKLNQSEDEESFQSDRHTVKRGNFFSAFLAVRSMQWVNRERDIALTNLATKAAAEVIQLQTYPIYPLSSSVDGEVINGKH